MTSDSLAQLYGTHAALIARLYAKAGGARWGLTTARFAQALERSTAHRFRGSNPAPAEVASYLESLHVEDLALACACRDGNEHAWEHFVGQYRNDLYAAARAIIGKHAGAGEAAARELADSIYAELYGLEPPSGDPAHPDGIPAQHARRRSLLDYFHGRSKLSTWLRAVLAQRHIDVLRASQRHESLEEKEEAGTALSVESGDPPDPDRARYLGCLHRALLEALAALSPRDQLRLSHYYVQELTLAQIGRILGEHEATTSRHLEKTRRELRRQVEQILRAENSLSEAQIHLCYEYAAEEWPFDLSGALGGAQVEASEKSRRAAIEGNSPRPVRGED